MNTNDRKKHWESIYNTKALTEVSWYQSIPKPSLEFFQSLDVDQHAKIIDVGGGDSFLVDHLLLAGYSNITVLDISEAAIERAKKRLGVEATKVNWIVADITTFQTDEKFDVWHDRAAFHFLNTNQDVQNYVERVHHFTSNKSHLIVGTFSMDGPLKCSGIPIRQYSKESLNEVFSSMWTEMESKILVHHTPFETDQEFVFSVFSKKC